MATFLKFIFALIAIASGITAIVGLFICGINIIQLIADKGGTYESAIAGFLMSAVGNIVAQIFYKIAVSIDDQNHLK